VNTQAGPAEESVVGRLAALAGAGPAAAQIVTGAEAAAVLALVRRLCAGVAGAVAGLRAEEHELAVAAADAAGRSDAWAAQTLAPRCRAVAGLIADLTAAAPEAAAASPGPDGWFGWEVTAPVSPAEPAGAVCAAGGDR
jgi:hypothetical protein